MFDLTGRAAAERCYPPATRTQKLLPPHQLLPTGCRTLVRRLIHFSGVINRKVIAAQLKEVSLLLDVLGEDSRRARNFAVTARTFENFDGDVEEFYRQGRLREIRGVGERTEEELIGLFEEGVMPLLVELRERVPEEVQELFAVRGLGPKRIGNLWRQGIVGIAGLLAAAKDGRLAELPGFGPKTVANMEEAARYALRAQGRMLLSEALSLAGLARSALEERLEGARVEVAGEARRRLETVSGIVLLVAGAQPEQLQTVAAELLDDPEAGGLSGRFGGRPLRLVPVDPAGFGSALLRETGSEEFLGGLSRLASEQDVDLEAAWITEEELFSALRLPWIPPELREDERFALVEYPQLSKAPGWRLVTQEDVRGIVHNHSNWSDGAVPIREMVEATRNAGFSYFALADHSQSSTVAGGLTAQRVQQQALEVAAIREELQAQGDGFELLHGLEVDILVDGALDLPDEVLAGLDYTVASVHQRFELSREAQTERVLAAIHSPHVHILAHPTGRLLLRRPEYEIDLDAIIDACAQTGTVIEINANPRRLDLDWRWVRKAAQKGCLFSVNPDAHTPDGISHLRYGVMMARKAGLSPEQVVNTAATGREFLQRLPKLAARRQPV